MAFFKSQLKTVLISRKDAQKGALLAINTPKCFKTWLL
jgi:hypothetical protein